MRLRIKNGRWFETTRAIRINDRLWYTQKGNWIYRRLAEPEVISEKEAVSVMLADGNWFEDHAGFADLPQHVRNQLEKHLDEEYPPAEEV